MVQIDSDPNFIAHCPECDTARVLSNIAHVVKCTECGYIVLGNDIV